MRDILQLLALQVAHNVDQGHGQQVEIQYAIIALQEQKIQILEVLIQLFVQGAD